MDLKGFLLDYEIVDNFLVDSRCFLDLARADHDRSWREFSGAVVSTSS